MSVQRYLDVSQASDVSAFERSLVHMAEEFGFPLVNGVLTIYGPNALEPSTTFAVGNTPAAFAESAADVELTEADPLIATLKRQKFQAITWDQDFYVKAGAAHLWEEQAQYGYKTGIAVCLDLPNNHRFALGLDRDQPLPAGPELTMLMANIQLLAVHAQAAADRILPQGDGLPLKVPLTPREIEILKYTMEGKSSVVIAQLLNINQGTVNFHVQKFCRKLGVASRLQAALRAQALRLI